MLKKYDSLLNLDATITKDLFLECEHPWEVLPMIELYILRIASKLGDDYLQNGDNVFVHKSAKISDSASISGPCIIGANTEVRPGAYIRGKVIIGDNCIVGNSSELKNAIMFNDSKCPHFNYVGDSVMGEFAHIGAGVILSNVKSDNSNIVVRDGNESYETGLRKFSAILGNHAEIGCNSVLCPGTIIGENSNVYPLTRVRGVVAPNSIVKNMDNIIEKEDR